MKTFEEYYQGVNDYCSIGPDKCRILFDALMTCPKGDMAEVGVYRGGVTMFMGNVAADLGVKVYGFDTFTGMPFQGEHDKHPVGDFNPIDFPDGALEAVQSRVNDSVELVQGVFTADIEGHDRQYAFVHLDADQYQSTMDGLKFFWPKMLPGGVILLDDYDWHACPGVKIALDEFGVPYTSQGLQALVRKT